LLGAEVDFEKIVIHRLDQGVKAQEFIGPLTGQGEVNPAERGARGRQTDPPVGIVGQRLSELRGIVEIIVQRQPFETAEGASLLAAFEIELEWPLESAPGALERRIAFETDRHVGEGLARALEGALAFLGLSISPPTPSWGNMINEGISYINSPNTGVGPWLVLFPGLAFCLLLLSINYIGDKLREHFDVTEGKL